MNNECVYWSSYWRYLLLLLMLMPSLFAVNTRTLLSVANAISFYGAFAFSTIHNTHTYRHEYLNEPKIALGWLRKVSRTRTYIRWSLCVCALKIIDKIRIIILKKREHTTKKDKTKQSVECILHTLTHALNINIL